MLKIVAHPKFFFFLLCLSTSFNALSQVSISAVVVDGSGQSVHGLQKSDFVVSSGKEAAFDSVQEIAPVRLDGFTEPVPVFVLYDAISMGLQAQGAVPKLLLDLLRQAADRHIAVTLLENTGESVLLIHDLSTDPRVLPAALDRIAKHPPSAQPAGTLAGEDPDLTKRVEDETAQLRELSKTVSLLATPLPQEQFLSLQMVAKMLQGSTKRKLLLWITGPVSGANPFYGGRFTPNPELRAALESLNNSRISVYPLLALSAGDYNMFDPNHGGARFYDPEEGRSGLNQIAVGSGGKLLGDLYVADFAKRVADLPKHFDSYYVLSFQAQPVRKESWVAISVKLAKSEGNVAVSDGFRVGP